LPIEEANIAAARLRGREPGVIIVEAAAAAAAAAAREEAAGFVAAAASVSCRLCLAEAVAEEGGTAPAWKRDPAPKAVAEGEGSVAAVVGEEEEERGGG
jgi:hypothetical protein